MEAMLCTCSNDFKPDHEGGTGAVAPHLGRLHDGSREFSAQLRQGEEMLRQGSIREAEAALREALSINNEVSTTSRPLCVQYVIFNF